jgi:autophagy-related protein 101
MEERRVASFSIDVFADKANAKDVVTGILHTIFWYRIFANLDPSYHDVLDIPIPWIQDVNLQTLVEQRVDQFVRQIDADVNDQSQNTRGQLVVQFSERERRRKKGWFGAKDEDLVWETWTLNIALASPRTPQGLSLHLDDPSRADILAQKQQTLGEP